MYAWALQRPSYQLHTMFDLYRLCTTHEVTLPTFIHVERWGLLQQPCQSTYLTDTDITELWYVYSLTIVLHHIGMHSDVCRAANVFRAFSHHQAQSVSVDDSLHFCLAMSASDAAGHQMVSLLRGTDWMSRHIYFRVVVRKAHGALAQNTVRYVLEHMGPDELINGQNTGVVQNPHLPIWAKFTPKRLRVNTQRSILHYVKVRRVSQASIYNVAPLPVRRKPYTQKNLHVYFNASL